MKALALVIASDTSKDFTSTFVVQAVKLRALLKAANPKILQILRFILFLFPIFNFI